VEYLPEVMWSYRTTPSSATSETPYSLAFGVEAVILVEIGSPSYRIQHYNPGFNSEGLKLHLDLLEEKREEASVRTSSYKAKAARYYNKKVKTRSFKLKTPQKGNWGQSGKDHSELLKSTRKEHTILKIQTGRSCHDHGMPSISRNIICNLLIF